MIENGTPLTLYFAKTYDDIEISSLSSGAVVYVEDESSIYIYDGTSLKQLKDPSKPTSAYVSQMIVERMPKYRFTGRIDLAYSSSVGTIPALAVIIYYPDVQLFDVHIMFSIDSFNSSYDSSTYPIFSFESIYQSCRELNNAVESLRFGDNSYYRNSFLTKCDNKFNSSISRGLVLSNNGKIGYYDSNGNLLYYSAGTTSGIYSPGSLYICDIYRAGFNRLS